jgi:DnaK suppressor protein
MSLRLPLRVPVAAFLGEVAVAVSPISFGAMDAERARELLAGERVRIEEALAALGRGGPQESDDRVEPGDRDSEGLYQDEFDAGRAEDLQRELEALERAEARLEAGTYGLSVESGEPIPDARLEAVPTAERTVAEEERFRGA